jgi:hypothetical protein
MSKSNEKKRDFFWLSYSDLMTSLFFVMLVLFVLVYTMQNQVIKELASSKKELDRIKEIENTVNNIDKKYFLYDSINKKHILNIDFNFATGSYDFFSTNKDVRSELVQAGRAIEKLIKKYPREMNVKYQVVIEGQASKDHYFSDEYRNNNILSYQRARALVLLWETNGVNLDMLDNCELVIAGSGEKGKPRKQPDVPPVNQRFLISIIPKIGELK